MKRPLLWMSVFMSTMAISGFAQIDSSSDNLWRIYESLEYSEGSNSDTWFIGDRELVRDVIRKLMARGAIRDLHRNALRRETFQHLNSLINQDYVEVMCVRRFDNEIQRLVLVSPYSPRVTDSIAPIVDRIHITDILGSEMYDQIKSRSYPVIGTSAHRFVTQQQTSFDVYLHLFNPHIMIWQDTQLIPDAGPTGGLEAQWLTRQRRWAVSLFARMGHDYLSLPSWYKSSIIGGLKVSYVDNTQYALKDKDYENFSIWVGYEETMNFTVPMGNDGSSNTFLKERRLQGTGAGVFARATWIPTYDYPKAGQYLRFAIEGAVSLTEKTGFGKGIPDTFYTVRNYATVSGSLRHLFGIVDVGAGFSWHDLQHISKATFPISRLEPTTNNVIPFLEVGISQDGSPLQYAISTQLNYNFRGYSFFIVKSQLMLSNWIGVDIRYSKGFGPIPSWHYDDYIVLSPIIRINY